MNNLPIDIQKQIYFQTIRRLRFEEHQKMFQSVHEELKKNEFKDIVRFRLDKISVFRLADIIFKEYGDDWLRINEEMEFYHSTSAIVKVGKKKYCLIGNKEHYVNCETCGYTYGLVDHRKLSLKCKTCHMNDK